MDNLFSRVSYLRGLMEGLKIDPESDEGKVFYAIADTLEDMSEAVALIDDRLNELDDYVDLLNEDLSEVERELFGVADDDFENDNYDFDDEDYNDFFDDEDIIVEDADDEDMND